MDRSTSTYQSYAPNRTVEYMRFSIVIPTHNREHKLQQCLIAATNQDYHDYEVIVVDDGSTDTTGAMVKREFPQVNYIHQESNRGPAVARNCGIAVASGDFVAFTDDDCLVPINWLQEFASALLQYPEVAGVGGYSEASRNTLSSNLYARYEAYLLHSHYRIGNKPYVGYFETPGCGTNNVAYRTDILQEVGGFDESFPYAAGEDTDLKKRTTEAGYKLLYLPLKVTHNHNFSWRSFHSQQITRGRGVVHFERRHNGAPPTRLRIVLRFIKRGLRFWLQLLPPPELRLALLRLLADWLNCYGQWLELSRLRKAPSPTYYEPGYYRSPRSDIADLVPRTALRILDVGCGEGQVGAMLKARQTERYIVGIELNQRVAQTARLHLDKVYQDDVQHAQLNELANSLDCIIYGDILEHLTQPFEVMRRHRPLLKKNGHVVVSVPNVQFYCVILSLLRGRWTYGGRGIFDRGHLRFFTQYEIHRLLSEVGYHVITTRRNYRLLERPSKINAAAAVIAKIRLLRPFLTYQYVLLAQKQTE